jgi:hypothetical protein
MRTAPIGFVRESAEQPRSLEGVAVPYGVVSRPTELLPGSGQIVREAWAPGAFTADVTAWGARSDGRRAPYRPRHDERPIGVIEQWTDAPEGVAFRASIFEGARGDEYLAEVRAGLNGVSIEGMWDTTPRKTRDGVILHRSGQLHGLAGSDSPAFDGAHVAQRDMEAAMADETATVTAPAEPALASRDAAAQATTQAATVAAAQPSQAERSAAEAATASRVQVRVTMPEAIYGPRSGNSYFADAIHAREGNTAAAERQARHTLLLHDQALLIERAGDVISSEIPGAYPNEYLPGLLTPRILKGRPMGGSLNRVPITDAQPKIFPKVTTSTTVAVQSAEGVNPAASDFATTAVTATPLLHGGSTDVSRQVIDGGSPSADAMIMQDLLEAYAQASETVIKTAVEAGASASGTAITAATPYAGTLGNVIKYQTTRFSPAELMFYPAALYAVLLAQGDTTGRPFLPALGPTNSDGTARAGGTGANILGADILLSWASTTNVVVTTRPNDYVIYESSVADFRYDQVVGPAAIRIGIWAYLVVGTRLGGLSVTAA